MSVRKVEFITGILTHYRIPFHNLVRTNLEREDVAYRVVYGQPTENEAKKQDLAELEWGLRVKNHYYFNNKLVCQPIWNLARSADLAVLGEESRFLVNYALQYARGSGHSRIAKWGPGRDFQSRNPQSLRESWKQHWVRYSDWWFGYTEETRNILISAGFPRERITVFNNTVDTSNIREIAKATSKQELDVLRRAYNIEGRHVGIYVGGLYEDKRLPFLLEAARGIREQCPDFELVIIGGGKLFDWLRAEVQQEAWIKVLGPKFGREKTQLMMVAQVFLMPGLVGLAVLDANAAGLPLITTAFPYHSPEFIYLKNGKNGVVVDEWEDAKAYASAVCRTLADEAALRMMSQNAITTAEIYTIENMARLFSDGVLAALDAPKTAYLLK